MANDLIAQFYMARDARIDSYEVEMPRYHETMVDLTRLDYEYNFGMLDAPLSRCHRISLSCKR